MNEKKFYVPAIILSAVAAALSLFCFSIEGIAAAIAALVLSKSKAALYRVKIPVVISIAAIIMGIGFLAMFFVISARTGYAASDYWFLNLFFDIPE